MQIMYLDFDDDDAVICCADAPCGQMDDADAANVIWTRERSDFRRTSNIEEKSRVETRRERCAEEQGQHLSGGGESGDGDEVSDAVNAGR